MPEIILPTKATQDDTNQKVTDMQALLDAGITVKSVKGVQRGMEFLSSSSYNVTSGTISIPIASVNAEKSIVFLHLYNPSGDHPDDNIYYHLDSSGGFITVRFHKYASHSHRYLWQVIEYY